MENIKEMKLLTLCSELDELAKEITTESKVEKVVLGVTPANNIFISVNDNISPILVGIEYNTDTKLYSVDMSYIKDQMISLINNHFNKLVNEWVV